jgi:hypothetical protein
MPGRRVVGAAAVVLTTGLVTGCAGRDPAPAPATSPSTSGATPPAVSTPSSTTSAAPVPGMPVPTATRDSPVDATRIRSLADLPAAFQCPTTVTPITITGTLPPTTGTPTGKPSTGTPTATSSGTPTSPSRPRATPDAVVCASRLAKDEALYLWYWVTPQDKLAALTAALAMTKYVHAGPNWVAGGTINADMGIVGGEVYR